MKGRPGKDDNRGGRLGRRKRHALMKGSPDRDGDRPVRRHLSTAGFLASMKGRPGKDGDVYLEHYRSAAFPPQ